VNEPDMFYSIFRHLVPRPCTSGSLFDILFVVVSTLALIVAKEFSIIPVSFCGVCSMHDPPFFDLASFCYNAPVCAQTTSGCCLWEESDHNDYWVTCSIRFIETLCPDLARADL